MALDIAMGGSTNTVLHLLAMAREGQVDFTMADIDRLSRGPLYLQSGPGDRAVSRRRRSARGIPAILGELLKGGKINPNRAPFRARRWAI